jgi:hypothetical protein
MMGFATLIACRVPGQFERREDYLAIGGIERKGFAPIHSARQCNVLARLAAVMVAACALACTGAKADDKYPAKPVRMMVSFAAGGPTDIVARVMSAKMSELMGQQFVVENRTGAGGNTGAAEIAKASPDGYSLLMATVSTHAINPGLYKKIPYDPIRDFAPVGQVGVTPILLVVRRYSERRSAGGERCDPRARRRDGGAHAHHAQPADAAGAGAHGLRVLHLECDPGAGRYTGADHRAAQRRDTEGDG